ncbi:major urinary protein 4-like [Sminthopsis crassicaudata]|uniref:major urinary protein 4-like n=1 Tax=Sminthopsis crassicaudata TaxID=9301 RepID=UPI003D68A1AF
MKILLLTFICGIHALDDKLPEITGKWYTIALASNVTSKIQKGGSLEIFVHKLYRNENNILSGDFFKKENDECTEFTVSASQENGDQLEVEYDGQNLVTIEHLDDESAMFALHNKKEGKNTLWMELFGRTPDLSKEKKKKFKKMCENFGILKNQIRYLSADDRCEKLR